MTPNPHQLQHQTRRHFLKNSQLGLGAIAMSSMLANDAPAKPQIVNPLAEKLPHFAAKAKRVIYLHMTGSPPNLDMWDHKPELVKRSGQDCPDEFIKGRRFAFTSGVPKLMGTPRKFEKRGKSGVWMSDAVPHLHEVADEMCVIHSMNTDQFNHAPAELFIYTGSPRSGRPSMGSWVTYGLGSENQDLPGFVVLISSGTQPNGGRKSYGSGFLPSVYQGVQCRSKGDPVLYVSDPEGVDRQLRRLSLDALRDLNQFQADELGHPETLTRIAQYELAYRMQVSVPEVMDITKEPKHVLEAYGAQPGASSLANNCLLARRLVEKGVRFVQLFDWGWDTHGSNQGESLNHGFRNKCSQTDKPIAALLQDLRQRGLMEDTLVVWGGEFGRTPMRENRMGGTMAFMGRDHSPDAFTIWMAGAGVKGGYSHGVTDPVGYTPAENPVQLRDLHATILRLMGFDHQTMSVPFKGLNQRLTGVKPAKIVQEILS